MKTRNVSIEVLKERKKGKKYCPPMTQQKNLQRDTLSFMCMDWFAYTVLESDEIKQGNNDIFFKDFCNKPDV